MRLRNLLTFEKGDQIMDAYYKTGLQSIVYICNILGFCSNLSNN